MKQASWRTTAAGILTIVAAVVGVIVKVLQGGAMDAGSLGALAAALTTGVGLIKAGDNANIPPKP